MIEIINLTKKFKKKTALENVNITFNTGVYGLLGPNGAGKTTLMRSMLGLYPIKIGDIQYNGVSIKKSNEASKRIGYLPQKFGLFRELTVFEMMEYLATLKHIQKVEQKEEIEKCVEQVNLSERINDKIGALSGGMVRRLGIAQALLGGSDVIIVDEPTAGLDPEERARFKNLISTIKEDKTIIISTHIVEDVEALCDYIIILKQGKVVGKGDSKNISKIALNKTYHIDANNENHLKGNYFIEKRYQVNGEHMLRVISDNEQNGIRVQPTIEDGYMCRIKGLG